MSLRTETAVGERQPMSRMRGLPSVGRGSVRTRVAPRTVPAASWRTRLETTRSALAPRTTATSRLPSRETRSDLAGRPVMPGTSTSLAEPSTTTMTRARPAPRSSSQMRSRWSQPGAARSTAPTTGLVVSPAAAWTGATSRSAPSSVTAAARAPVRSTPTERTPRSTVPSGPAVGSKAPIPPETSSPRSSANSSALGRTPLGS